MKKTPPMHRRPLMGAALLACSLLATSSIAQDSMEDDAVYVLSPFNVTTTEDMGYLAQNTLAGSRIDTSLRDVGAAISVLTLEFLDDIGATSMKDVILFSNNSVPDYGDAATNFNGNPMIGNAETQLRIRGLAASYGRNYFTWDTSSDFYNVERIDQSRGPNAILFGFGSAGGIVNTTTKQASVVDIDTVVSLTAGSWNRLRGTIDTNHVIRDGAFAVRLNAMSESNDTWRKFESYEANRAHLAAKYVINPRSSLRAEVEAGKVKDNIARPWLMIDQAWQWRQDGRPVYESAQWDWPVSDSITQTWSEHMVFVENTGEVMNWQGMPFSYLSGMSWSHLEMTPENLSMIPRETNSAGPAANRDTDYLTYTALYENRLTDNLSMELAYNHQETDFLGYDPNSGNLTRYSYMGDSTNIWGDASAYTPTWEANPYAGRLYLENNWTRRTQDRSSDTLRLTGAYDLDLNQFGRHRLAVLLEQTWRDHMSVENAEVFLGSPYAAEAEFDSNRVFRRYYFEEGNASDIRVPSWKQALNNVVDPVTGQTLTAGWVPNQEIANSDQEQFTVMVATQSNFFDNHLVATLGFRHDQLDYSKLPTVRDSSGVLVLDSGNPYSKDFSADTATLGLVYHVTDQISLFANRSNSRNLPNVNQRILGIGVPPMAEGEGTDVGVKLNLLGGRIYATINYYTTDYSKTTEWGNIFADVTSRNNRFLDTFVDAGLISAADRDSRVLDANAYMEDRESKGWEMELIANPTDNWRISLNLSTNEVIKTNIMTEVAEWAAVNTAYWIDVAGEDFLLGGGDWDTLGNNIGWMMDYINQQTSFNGYPARGERGFGASLYTRYQIKESVLKGFSVGGGARYQDANVIAMVDGREITGEDLFLTDLMMGYQFETTIFGRDTRVDLQLNIANAFDEDKDQVYTVAWWDPTKPERIGLQEPRKFTFTATLSF